MEGLLVFDCTTQSTLTLLPRPQIPKFTRKKTGCLTCRARRKKCGEQKPVCIGCSRNHLLCTWPPSSSHKLASAKSSIQNGTIVHDSTCTVANSPKAPRSGPSQASLMTSNTQGPGVNSEVSSSSNSSMPNPRAVAQSSRSPASRLGTSPAWWPKLQYDRCAQRLLQHYIERTSSKLAAINFPEKPYVNHLLPLAYTNDGILHAMLALSSSHLSFHDEASTALTHSHYAVALRAAKYEVTNVAKGTCNAALNLLVLLLLLCQFEGVDGDMRGAILYHLTACKTLLSMVHELLQSTDENFVCFLLEQYVYLKIVANNVGLTTEPKETNSSIIEELTGSIRSLIVRSSNHGFMFGYAYELFELIPRISQFSHRRVTTSPRHNDDELLRGFMAFELQILEWKPDPQCPLISAHISKELDDLARTAGQLYQHALLVFLRIALHGPGIPTPHLMMQIGHSIDESLQLIRNLPLDSTVWTTLLWAVLTIGSCMTEAEDQQFLISALHNQQHEMHGCTRVLTVLQWVWENCKRDEKFYGPYGIDRVLTLYNVKLSFA